MDPKSSGNNTKTTIDDFIKHERIFKFDLNDLNFYQVDLKSV